jgi:hypothetical protein
MNVNNQKVYLFITSQKVDLAENNSKILANQINKNFQVKSTY